MTRAWLVVVLVGAATVAIKGAGPVLLGDRGRVTRPRSALEQLAPSLMPGILAALVVTQVFSRGQRLTLDARLVGLLIAVAGAHWRAPPAAIVVGAALATALARLLVR
jgi:Branched-chain amino acid transport protein (AzlD)